MSFFEERYGKLNPEQKKAVDHIYGPLMVLAGPGTGKTHVLTLRIANILKKADTGPDQILAITFTDAAAKEMKKRLFSLIGLPALQVKMATFHAFCNEILETYPEYASLPIGSRPIEELEQLQIIEELVDRLKLKNLKPYGDHHYFVPHIKRRIQQLKQEAVSPEKFAKDISAEQKKINKKTRVHVTGVHKGKEKAEVLAREHMLEKNHELATVYAEYEKKLHADRLYDFSDMLLATVAAIKKHKTLARTLREKYEFILVDEHQDTNNAQQELIELLVKGIEEPNVCVVGDEKQAIYRFQGGSMENFLYFKKKFPSAVGIALIESFRSKQRVLDAVQKLGEKISPRSGNLVGITDLVSARVRVCECKTPEAELSYVVQDIRHKINAGDNPSDIAVLYRDNKDAQLLKIAMDTYDVLHTFEAEQNIFTDPNIRNLLKIINAVAKSGDERAVVEALHTKCFNLKPHELYRWMLELQKAENRSVFASNNPAVRLLQELSIEDANNNITRTLELILQRTGFLASIINSYRELRNVRALFDVAKEMERKNPEAKCADLIAFIERAKKHGIQLKPKEDDSHPQGVRCMTAHRAKGREFKHVYIIHAYDGHWGNRSIRDPLPLPEGLFSMLKNKKETNIEEDEMRLLYVACTRAKDSLCISYPKVSFSGREVLASRFLEMLDNGHLSYISGYLYKGDIPTFETEKNTETDSSEKELLWSLLRERGLSVTAVNNFYDCAWKFIYVNMLRIPKTKSKWEQFGTAAHAALRDFFSMYAKEATGEKYMLERFEYHLKNERLDERTHEELLQKGRIALETYFKSHPNGWHKKYLLEYSLIDVDAGFPIALNGKLDKVEILDPKLGFGLGKPSFGSIPVRVIDYKTGKMKSRNEIEGKTKNSNGDIFRQIVFYKMLLDFVGNIATGGLRMKPSMKEGVIEFIESDPFRSEAFEVLPVNIEKLRGEIDALIASFEKGTYESFACHEKDCEYCTLRNDSIRKI